MNLPVNKYSLTSVIATVLLVAFTAQAQPKPDNYGGLGDYPVPSGGGAGPEFQYCVVYAKRAWRVANLIEERAVTISQAKEWARNGLGKNAAAEEVQDFERLETKGYASPHVLGAERFFRCAAQLRLNPVSRHKSNAEFCFRSIKVLDFVARMREEGKTREQAKSVVLARRLATDQAFVDRTVNLAFSGPSLAEGSSLIEDTFSSCFAEAGERQGKIPQ